MTPSNNDEAVHTYSERYMIWEVRHTIRLTINVVTGEVHILHLQEQQINGHWKNIGDPGWRGTANLLLEAFDHNGGPEVAPKGFRTLLVLGASEQEMADGSMCAKRLGFTIPESWVDPIRRLTVTFRAP